MNTSQQPHHADLLPTSNSDVENVREGTVSDLGVTLGDWQVVPIMNNRAYVIGAVGIPGKLPQTICNVWTKPDADVMAASKELYEFAAFNLERNFNADTRVEGESLLDLFAAKWFGKYPQFKPEHPWDMYESCNRLSDFLRDRALAKARGEKQ